MRKTIIFAILMLVVLVGLAQFRAQAETEHRIFLPLVIRPVTEFDPKPDGEFPGTMVRVVGPKIVETWSAPWNQCRIFKLNLGETFDWPFNGHVFSFETQSELDQRYPEHRDAFLAKTGNEACSEGVPVEPPTPTPTATSEPTIEPTLEPTATATPAPPTEGEFPGTTGEFSIIEWWDGSDACGIFLSDSPFTYEQYGHYWSYQNAQFRDDAYPAHLASFFEKPENAGCVEDRP